MDLEAMLGLKDANKVEEQSDNLLNFFDDVQPIKK